MPDGASQRSWKWVVDPERWAELKAKAIQAKRSKDVLGLVAPDEANDAADAMAPGSFLAFVQRCEATRCTIG